jgi:hypothetical protein
LEEITARRLAENGGKDAVYSTVAAILKLEPSVGESTASDSGLTARWIARFNAEF